MSLGNTTFREIDRKSRASLEPIRYYKRALEDRIDDFEETTPGGTKSRLGLMTSFSPYMPKGMNKNPGWF